MTEIIHTVHLAFLSLSSCGIISPAYLPRCQPLVQAHQYLRVVRSCYRTLPCAQAKSLSLQIVRKPHGTSLTNNAALSLNISWSRWI